MKLSLKILMGLACMALVLGGCKKKDEQTPPQPKSDIVQGIKAPLDAAKALSQKEETRESEVEQQAELLIEDQY